ncbi:MAG: hypothetical protein WBZ05_04495 [Desulfobacterales bacterium]
MANFSDTTVKWVESNEFFIEGVSIGRNAVRVSSKTETINTALTVATPAPNMLSTPLNKLILNSCLAILPKIAITTKEAKIIHRKLNIRFNKNRLS